MAVNLVKMIVVLQRVKKAQVIIDEKIYSKIGSGILIFIGIQNKDKEKNAKFLANKIYNLRIFSDDKKKLNKNIKDVNGEIMVVSQFTLYGDCQKGSRPSFIKSAPKSHALPVYDFFVNRLKEFQIPVKTGKFGADMQVNLENDGPVTLIIKSENE